MHNVLREYFRSESQDIFHLQGPLSDDAGYFRFGDDAICYGRTAKGSRAQKPDQDLYNVADDVRVANHGIELPFDPAQVIENFYYERYVPHSRASLLKTAIRETYYFARPVIPVSVRKHLQKLHLSDWRNLTFPRWPVDTTVDGLLEKLLAMTVQARGGEKVPFVWFWPKGASGCAVMTHDVETELGVELSSLIMDMNDSYGIPGSFQIVPEERYQVTDRYLNSLRDRGFEINVQGLNHDGHLFAEKESFKKRAAKINKYANEYGAVGFRSPILYRNQEWFEFLDFEYDTSVPNVGHLDPQRGGCCTVMPYFVGNILELPVTMTQDYSQFHILNDRSLTLWQRQIEIILSKHGLINAIIHPDYLTGPREREHFKGLLEIYARLRREQNVWIALPKDVNSWWRSRSQMKPVFRDGQWQIEGEGSERACLAFATSDGDRLEYRILLPGGGVSKFCPNACERQAKQHVARG
jgi:hypothetical protein